MSLSADEARRLATSEDPLDYQELGFMCGLEIHQQLATRKLFSLCPSDVVDPDAVKERTIAQTARRLRATQSELGESDPAALAEAKKRKSFRYLSIDGLTSLVELDEEPPQPMSDDALDVTLTYAGLLGAKPADEVHVMRKTVIDGSNTSGFQRTSLIATGGQVEPEEGDPVGIWTIAVEEDSARKVDDGSLGREAAEWPRLRGKVPEAVDGLVTFTLDRLGVPLIEVATAPDITDPKHAQHTARRLGALLRATGRVRRGLGSIRQDLNVSIGVGSRVEIKGCQDLRAVPRVIETEVRRQLWLHYVAETLRERGFDSADLGAPVDVTDAFTDCESKVVQGALKKKHHVFALKLPHWSGLIAGASKDGPRYGREFAGHAKAAAGVKGVFHSDELPAYGITQGEVDTVAKTLDLGDDDAFVLCVERAAVATSALEAVAHCAADALAGAGRAVRAAQPDDSTRYMRPLPGAARMYPETDVPPIRITKEHWQGVLDRLPPKPEEVVAKYTAGGLSEDLAKQIVRDGLTSIFDQYRSVGFDPSLAGTLVTQVFPDLSHPDTVAQQAGPTYDVFSQGRFAKEALPDILKALDEGAADVDAAIARAGAQAADEGVVDEVIEAVIADRLDFVRDRGMGAMGPLMGPVMQELRGKADGALISERLKAAIEKALA